MLCSLPNLKLQKLTHKDLELELAVFTRSLLVIYYISYYFIGMTLGIILEQLNNVQYLLYYFNVKKNAISSPITAFLVDFIQIAKIGEINNSKSIDMQFEERCK